MDTLARARTPALQGDFAGRLPSSRLRSLCIDMPSSRAGALTLCPSWTRCAAASLNSAVYTWRGTLNISSFLPLRRAYTRTTERRNFRGSPVPVPKHSGWLPGALADAAAYPSSFASGESLEASPSAAALPVFASRVLKCAICSARSCGLACRSGRTFQSNTVRATCA